MKRNQRLSTVRARNCPGLVTKWSLKTWEDYLYKKLSFSHASTKWCAQPDPLLNQHPRKACEVQGWKALLWGVPLSATKNASDWQRSSKRLITSGLLTFLHFFCQDLCWKEVRSFSWMFLYERCFWMPLEAFRFFFGLLNLYIIYTYTHGFK